MPLPSCEEHVRYASTPVRTPERSLGAGCVESFSTTYPKGMIDSAVHERSHVPSSHAYRPSKVRGKIGVKFSEAFPKNDVAGKSITPSKRPALASLLGSQCA